VASTENPYSPPKAVVADVNYAPPMARPRSVTVAVALLAIGVLLGLLQNAIVWISGDRGSITTPYIVGQVLGIVIAVWIYYKIAQGRNWARIVLLVLYAFVIVAFGIGMWAISSGLVPIEKSALGFNLVLQVVQLLMDAVALYLLFVPGREWFRPRIN